MKKFQVPRGEVFINAKISEKYQIRLQDGELFTSFSAKDIVGKEINQICRFEHTRTKDFVDADDVMLISDDCGYHLSPLEGKDKTLVVLRISELKRQDGTLHTKTKDYENGDLPHRGMRVAINGKTQLILKMIDVSLNKNREGSRKNKGQGEGIMDIEFQSMPIHIPAILNTQGDALIINEDYPLFTPFLYEGFNQSDIEYKNLKKLYIAMYWIAKGAKKWYNKHMTKVSDAFRESISDEEILFLSNSVGVAVVNALINYAKDHKKDFLKISASLKDKNNAKEDNKVAQVKIKADEQEELDITDIKQELKELDIDLDS